MKPTLKAPGTKRLTLRYVKLLSSFAFNFSLRRYTTDSTTILSEIKNFEPEFEFIYLDMDRAKYNTKSKIESQMSSNNGFDSHDVMISSLRDMLLLAAGPPLWPYTRSVFSST
jgi:hypothetical protein